MNNGSDQIIAVVGPTASGKSALAVSLAQIMDGEVISGDSMQIYRGLDIGTAKATAAERRGIPHHLLDLRDPGESFSAADYQALARRAIEEIRSRGMRPILAGGTGLYIDSALYNYEYEPEGNRRSSPASREALTAEAKEKGPAALWERLRAKDPDAAGRLHPNDTKRIIRALEYESAHDKPISMNRAARKTPELIFPTVLIGLNLRRELLYRRIDRRVDLMMESGLPAEVAALCERGALKPETQSGQAIGYKQLMFHLDGEFSLDQAVNAIKRESRRYAKRQLTWFRRNPDIIWINAEKAFEGEKITELARLLGDGDVAADTGGLRGLIRQMGLAFPDS